MKDLEKRLDAVQRRIGAKQGVRLLVCHFLPDETDAEYAARIDELRAQHAGSNVGIVKFVRAPAR